MIQGSCLCGCVAFEATKLSSPIGHCHCTMCRKAHSAAFATTARVARTDFRWLRGQELIRSFESSPGKLRHFCGTCGTQLIAEWTDQAEIILRLGALDTDPGVRPTIHIWVADAVPWLTYGPDLPRLSGGRGSQPVAVSGGD
jgi:hypothetical protein